MTFGPISDPLNYAIGLMLGGGWILVFWGIKMLFDGRLMTRREGNAKDKVIDKQQETIDELKDQLQLMRSEVGPLVIHTVEGIKSVVEQHGRSDS